MAPHFSDGTAVPGDRRVTRDKPVKREYWFAVQAPNRPTYPLSAKIRNAVSRAWSRDWASKEAPG